MDRNNAITISPASTGQSIETDLQIGSNNHHIFFRSNQEALAPNLEAFIALTLLPAMLSGGGTLSAKGHVSQQLINHIEVIQNVYSSWNPKFQHVELEGFTPIHRKTNQQGRVAAFFSGGVDSFYTLLKHQNEITDLIFVHGLGLAQTKDPRDPMLIDSIHQVADHFGKNLIEIETNLRPYQDSFVHYAHWGWSIPLAAIGHLLHPYLKRLIYPEGYDYSHMVPSGDILFPLWFSEGIEFISDGLETTRFDKVAAISDSDIALKNLHVCYKKSGRTLNCGNCEKCVRTMVSLEVNDALDRCTTFGKDLDLNYIKYHPIQQNSLPFFQQSLDALEKKEGKEPLKSALQKLINKPQWQRYLDKKVFNLKNRFII